MFFGGGMPGMPGMQGKSGGPGIHVFHMGGMGPMGPMGPMGGMFQGDFGNHMFEQFQKPPPIIKNIEITLEHAYNGGNYTFDVERVIMKNGMRMNEIEKMTISIPKGINENEIIIKRGCGNMFNDNLAGDLKLIVNISKDAQFERMGNDLIYKHYISLKDALCGFNFEIRHLNGKLIQMNNTSKHTIIKPGFKKTIQNLGMIREDQYQTTGNLIIEFNIEFPDTLSNDKIQILKDIL